MQITTNMQDMIEKRNVLCLDMSTKSTGYAIAKDSKVVDYGMLKSEEKNPLDRIKVMYDFIYGLVKDNDIDLIVAEDVPISDRSNLKVGKDLCLLQGCLLSIGFDENIGVLLLHPTEWREKIGMLISVYSGKKGGQMFGDKSGVDVKCENCGNDRQRDFSRTPQNLRAQLKQRAVEVANEKFGLELFFKHGSKKNEDDIAEALCLFLGYEELKKWQEKRLKK